MNSLEESNVVKGMQWGTDFAYIMNDNGKFLQTEYKVYQSQGNIGFVECMKILYNGKIALYYQTKDLRTFQSMIYTLDPNSLMTIISNLFGIILEAKNNGFLCCQNINISFDKIYIEPDGLKVKLIYIPVSDRAYVDNNAFERELRTSLMNLIDATESLQSPKTMMFLRNLADQSISLEDLYNKVRGAGTMSTYASAGTASLINNASQTLYLVAMNAPRRMEICVNKDEFFLGKNPISVDGVIGFNKAISRVHCEIVKRGGQYFVVDLESVNGTYVNGNRVIPGQMYPVKNNDILRLANSDFQLCFR